MNQTLLKMIAIALPLAAAGASTSLAHDQTDKTGALTIASPYVRAMLPGAKVGGGYLSIANQGPDDRLVGVSCACAGSVEIHEMKVDGGVMTMKPLKGGIAVPAHGTVELKPGGYHLMFMNVAQPFKEGDTVKASLNFEKAGSVAIDMIVGPAAGGAPKMDHHAKP